MPEGEREVSEGTKKVRQELEARIARMQTPEGRRALKRAFEAAPTAMGIAAVRAARAARVPG